MFDIRSRASQFLTLIPFICLAWSVGVWIQYGIDFPWYDDWRGYQNGNIESLQLSYLFGPINDTLSPVGLVLDAIFQRFIGGNSVVYQLISMIVVLGSLLILQLSMLRRVLCSERQVALCFLFTLPMLQPGSYWGAQNLAYHQALPILFFVAAIWIIFFSRMRDSVRLPILGVLGILSGLSYISGAFIFLVGGFFLLIASTRFAGDVRNSLFQGSIPLLITGFVTSLIQLTFAFDGFGSTHSDVPIAYPVQVNFWLYLFGKIARSLLLPNHYPWLALIATVIAIAALIFLAALVCRNLVLASHTEEKKYQTGMIFLTLFVVLGSYLLIVAAGRANYYSKVEVYSLDSFVAGFDRFHFFWVTLLWPWVVAVVCRYTTKFAIVSNGPLFFVSAIALFGIMSAGNVWQHVSWHQMAIEIRKPVFDCFAKSINDGRGIHCERLLPVGEVNGLPDATPAYLHALKINASFLRYLPRLDDLTRSFDLKPLLIMDGMSEKLVLEDLERSDGGLLNVVGHFPKIYIRDLPIAALSGCVRLDVVLRSRAESAGHFQLFFQRSDDLVYQESFSKKATVPSEMVNLQESNFKISSLSGFGSEMRLDSGKNLKMFQIKQIEFYCLLEKH